MNKSGFLSASLPVTIGILLLSISCTRFSGNGFRSSWERHQDSRWAGPDLWANRLADWEVKDRRLFCSGSQPMRTVHLLTRRVNSLEGDFMTLVNIRRDGTGQIANNVSAGILIGAGPSLDYRSASLIFNSYGAGAGYYFGIDSQGKVFIRDFSCDNSFISIAEKGGGTWHEAILKITASSNDLENTRLNVIAVDPSTSVVISEIKSVTLPSLKISGNIALVADAGNAKPEIFSFAHWIVRGSRIEANREHNIGPVVTAQYTLNRGTLKLTAQLMPVEKGMCDSVELQFIDEDEWQTAVVSPVDTPSYTSSFKIPNWSSGDDKPYRLVARYRYGHENTNSLNGIIKHDPVEKDKIKVLALSSCEQYVKSYHNKQGGVNNGWFPFENGIFYPHIELINNLEKQHADLLFFAGDQVSGSDFPAVADLSKNATLDYLYKWYLWCISFRDLTTTIPSITIPDENDVFQENLWGNSGRSIPRGISGAEARDAGGYIMPARFVNMVQKTQSSHLPDPVDPEPVENGIGVYFTDCNIGGVSFAVIEDRKFKSAPAPLLPDAMIRDGWPENPGFSTRRGSDVAGATLLGERQDRFLEKWADDWSGGAWMKVVLSQTLWSSLVTIPDSVVSGDMLAYLPVPDSGRYITGDRIGTDFNTGGWPQSSRNSALKTIRKAFALHISGDPYLGSTIQYGIDTWGDAGYAITTPPISNLPHGRWFPPEGGMNRKEACPLYTGDFEDGFGNKITVFAVANPGRNNTGSEGQNQLAAGYSAVTFDKKSREIELSNWPGSEDPQTGTQFPGWPVKISQYDNYGRNVIAWLPPVVTEGMNDPVIRVINESTGEVLYTLRISGNTFQPGVFSYGLYTIEAGDPDREIWKRLTGIAAWSTKERQSVTITF